MYVSLNAFREVWVFDKLYDEFLQFLIRPRDPLNTSFGHAALSVFDRLSAFLRITGYVFFHRRSCEAIGLVAGWPMLCLSIIRNVPSLYCPFLCCARSKRWVCNRNIMTEVASAIANGRSGARSLRFSVFRTLPTPVRAADRINVCVMLCSRSLRCYECELDPPHHSPQFSHRWFLSDWFVALLMARGAKKLFYTLDFFHWFGFVFLFIKIFLKFRTLVKTYKIS